MQDQRMRFKLTPRGVSFSEGDGCTLSFHVEKYLLEKHDGTPCYTANCLDCSVCISTNDQSIAVIPNKPIYVDDLKGVQAIADGCTWARYYSSEKPVPEPVKKPLVYRGTITEVRVQNGTSVALTVQYYDSKRPDDLKVIYPLVEFEWSEPLGIKQGYHEGSSVLKMVTNCIYTDKPFSVIL